MKRALRLWLIDLQRLRWPEFWPAWLFYIPVVLNYLWLSLRYGDPRLASLSNPGIDNGGLINESKAGILALIPAAEPSLLRFHAWAGGTDAASIQAWMQSESLSFPVIAKPDAGQRGSGVRLCRSLVELAAYAVAADYRFITQEYCPLQGEAGVFYVRFPHEAHGRLFSVTKKIFPAITGDGRRSVAELILADPRNRNMARVLFRRHAARLDERLGEGESLRLVESGNHCQGTVFLNGASLATAALTAAIDALAISMPGFYIGRFDLRYESDTELAKGRGFKIIEVNGASSEATHIYDPAMPLTTIYATLFEQWRLVFAIGAENRERGLKPSSLGELWSSLRAYQASSRNHPLAS